MVVPVSASLYDFYISADKAVSGLAYTHARTHRHIHTYTRTRSRRVKSELSRRMAILASQTVNTFLNKSFLPRPPRALLSNPRRPPPSFSRSSARISSPYRELSFGLCIILWIVGGVASKGIHGPTWAASTFSTSWLGSYALGESSSLPIRRLTCGGHHYLMSA